MRFHAITKQKPSNGQWCFIRERDASGKRVILCTTAQPWYADTGFGENHGRVVSWSPVPLHIIEDPRGWRSPYRGDDLPDRNAECIVCTETRKTPFYAYFCPDLGRFLGVHVDVIAYRLVD